MSLLFETSHHDGLFKLIISPFRESLPCRGGGAYAPDDSGWRCWSTELLLGSPMTNRYQWRVRLNVIQFRCLPSWPPHTEFLKVHKHVIHTVKTVNVTCSPGFSTDA